MGIFHTPNAILQSPHTMRRVDVVLAATPNLTSSGLIRRCSTATIEIDIMALMPCPSALSAPTLVGHFYACNAILQVLHTMRRKDVGLAANSNLGRMVVLMSLSSCSFTLGSIRIAIDDSYLHYV